MSVVIHWVNSNIMMLNYLDWRRRAVSGGRRCWETRKKREWSKEDMWERRIERAVFRVEGWSRERGSRKWVEGLARLFRRMRVRLF